MTAVREITTPQTAPMTAVQVRKVTEAEHRDWDQLIERFPGHRVVHKRAWIEWLEACGCGQPLFLVFERDGAIVGAIPGLLVRLGLLRLYGSPLPGWQTPAMGPVFDPSRLSTEELIDALVPFLEKEYGVHHLEIMSANLNGDALRARGLREETIPTYRAPLFPDDTARAWRQFKDSARRNVRRAEKLGLVVRFEEDNDAFITEHYAQVREVFVRGGHSVPFSERRAREFFQRMRAAGKLVAVSIYLPSGENIASGLFTIDGRELLLLSWAHRTAHRWFRPTELLTWAVMQRAMALGCDTFDFMGLGAFKTKFGAVKDESTRRWTRSR
jgi:CelD/BcsL family acetyltransferase involved in cellulose biosynthesis